MQYVKYYHNLFRTSKHLAPINSIILSCEFVETSRLKVDVSIVIPNQSTSQSVKGAKTSEHELHHYYLRSYWILNLTRGQHWNQLFLRKRFLSHCYCKSNDCREHHGIRIPSKLLNNHEHNSPNSPIDIVVNRFGKKVVIGIILSNYLSLPVPNEMILLIVVPADIQMRHNTITVLSTKL